ncbi:hypothetical protein CPB85DRAFT_1308804 [Mucidula mucida]|nr:hypothetical protein CPB85DRAFT_1308804 [Mucidula mucida]
MSYSYYHSVPGWGTNQFQFGAPPAPTFQPQPSWGGLDYYRAHAHTPDPDLYGHAWNRVRDFRDYTSAAGLGVGIHEARHWHRRAYGGLAELNTLLAPEIGHAAAYEAYRTWIHNSSIYEPLSGETERQREGLIGLAVAEATRLLSYTPRLNMDPYTRQTASESAAMTASILFYWSRDHNDDEYRGRSGYGSDYDPYTYDTNVMYPHRGRSRSRRRSLSVSSYNHVNVPPMGGSAVGMPSGGMMGTPYPGQAGSYMGQPGSYPGQPGSYPGQSYVGSQYGGGGGGGMPVPMSAGGYAASDPAGGYGTPYPGQASGVPMVVPPMGGRPRSMSMSVPYAPMQGTPYPGGTVMSSAPPAQVVVVKSHKKHRHHHHSRHSRSRSRY